MDRRKATEAEASALASGIRLRIIRLTKGEALTNKELAERLGRDPATTLHHVRKLVETGFLEPQPPRRGKRGAKEIPYLSTGLSWALLCQGSPHHRDIKQAVLEAYLGEISEIDVGELLQRRLVLTLGPDAREEFEQRINSLLDEFAARADEGGADAFAIYVATYPSR
ncbi:ArsR/SmtB family transcription factor [Amycolatopsis taiwanensis]|uniref:ArsR family transcriptional regulator n=1 Tax=Amycolatopsis taiwanensis TaxID=342230 RepID=A0A9W6R0Q4_9PSEU|nr:helix-turn-helix domain-containing protein [Amycolatopsis taiwanensis]GLY66300.1 ArsR family transcriptional regulator [Amycolatopsis taiwanensis]